MKHNSFEQRITITDELRLKIEVQLLVGSTNVDWLGSLCEN